MRVDVVHICPERGFAAADQQLFRTVRAQRHAGRLPSAAQRIERVAYDGSVE
jgi:hypothetical protein